MTDRPELTFIIEDKSDSSQTIPIGTFLKVMGGLANVASEVDRETSRTHQKTVEWKISGLKTGSPAECSITPIAFRPTAYPAEKLPYIIRDGLDAIQKGLQRPSEFNDKALASLREAVRSLGKRFNLYVAEDTAKFAIDSQTIAQIDNWLEAFRESIGTIEGSLESVSVHEQNKFTIWAKSGHRIDCNFPDSMLPDVTAALEKKARVCIRGKIKYRADGVPAHMKATLLHTFKTNEELPQVEDIMGLWKLGTTGDQYIREMRDGR